MNPPSPFMTDGPNLGLVNLANPVAPPCTPRVEAPGRPNTLEERMEALKQEMANMQEHNNIISSKLDDAQKQLHEQQSHSAQLQDGLDQTMQLWQEQSLKSMSKPNGQERGKQSAAGGPSVSRRLFVPSPEQRHQEYRVYSDCRNRLNDRHREQRTSPIPIRAKLNDWHLDVLGPKSHIRRRYDTIGLEETDESDYIPTSPGMMISCQSTTGPRGTRTRCSPPSQPPDVRTLR
ncbi:unnamed protein product [Prunus brigantina]